MSYFDDFLRTELCPFPKHLDETWVEVIQRDRDYVRWIVENIEDLDEDLRDALEWGIDNVPDRI